MLIPLVMDIKEACSWNLYAIVLIGSLARGEATIKKGQILSDLDMHIVTKTFSTSVDRKISSLVKKHCEYLPFKIYFGTVPRFLYGIYKCIEYYEARKNGYVIYGPRNVTDEISIKDPAQIPVWEGVRLLLNRALGLLESFHNRRNGDYAIAKSYLGIAEAYLVFDKRYRATYRERHDEILNRCRLKCVDNFLEKYLSAYRYKMNFQEDIGNLTLHRTVADLLKAVNYFLGLFLDCSGSLQQKLEALSSRFLNPYHSLLLFWNKIEKGKFDPRFLFIEPCIYIWKRGMNHLIDIERGKQDSKDVRLNELLQEWKNTPQFLLLK